MAIGAKVPGSLCASKRPNWIAPTSTKDVIKSVISGLLELFGGGTDRFSKVAALRGIGDTAIATNQQIKVLFVAIRGIEIKFERIGTVDADLTGKVLNQCSIICFCQVAMNIHKCAAKFRL